MIMKNVFNVFIVPVFLLFGLQDGNNLIQNKHSDTMKTNNDRIIYLFFKADKDQSGNAKITLQSTKIAEGRLKYMPPFERDNVRKGDLIITLIGSADKEEGKQLVKDPFNPEMEVYEKEGISRHKASLQNAEFSTRFSYSENVQSVKIEKATDDGVQLIFTQKL